jgi:hypothetical protein
MAKCSELILFVELGFKKSYRCEKWNIGNYKDDLQYTKLGKAGLIHDQRYQTCSDDTMSD